MTKKRDPSHHQAERYRPKGVEATNLSPSRAIKAPSKIPIKQITFDERSKPEGIIKDAFKRAENATLSKMEGDEASLRSAGLTSKYVYKTGKYAALAGKSVAGATVRTGTAMTFKRAAYGGTKNAFKQKAASGFILGRQSIKKVIKSEIKSSVRDFRGSDDLGIQAITRTKDAAIKTKQAAKTAKTIGKATFKTIKTGTKLTVKAVNVAADLSAKLFAFIAANPIVLFTLIIVLVIVVICSTVMSIIPAISLKSDEKELANTYFYVTQLDANFVKEIKAIQDDYSDIDEFHYFIDDIEIDPDNLRIYTNADYILMYLDSKYEDYALDNFIYGLFGGTNVRGEVEALHAALNSHAESEREEQREHTSIDPEGHENTETETVHCLDIHISTTDFRDYIEENWESLLDGNEKEMFDILLEVGCYITKVELGNPFADTNNGVYSASSRWGQRYHPISSELKPHKGIDIPQPAGTPINNVMAGTVVTVGFDADGYGNYVQVKNAAGDKNVLYGHMLSVAVTEGTQVEQGDIIGYVGSTGASTGPHLHLEYNILNGFNTNPGFYLKGAAYTGN